MAPRENDGQKCQVRPESENDGKRAEEPELRCGHEHDGYDRPRNGSEAGHILPTSVDRDGVVYVGETPMSRTEFVESFGQIVSGGTVEEVWIKGDSLATWGAGVDVMSAVHAAGIPFSIVAEQRPRR